MSKLGPDILHSSTTKIAHIDNFAENLDPRSIWNPLTKPAQQSLNIYWGCCCSIGTVFGRTLLSCGTNLLLVEIGTILFRPWPVTHQPHGFKCVLSAHMDNMHCKYVNLCLCMKNDWGKLAGGQRKLDSPLNCIVVGILSQLWESVSQRSIMFGKQG